MIKTLKIQFEGIESVDINGEYVKQFKSTNTTRIDKEGNIVEVNKLEVVLDKNANKEYNEPLNSEHTVFDRIACFNDITSFDIEDEKSVYIMLTDYEPDRGELNKNQYTKINENGDLHILITDNEDLVPSGFTQPSLMPIGEVIYDEDC